MSGAENGCTTVESPDPLLAPLPDQRHGSQSAEDTSTASSQSPTAILPQTKKPDMCLVICGISKKPNVHALLQTAAAFGIRQVLVVGQQRNLPVNDDERVVTTNVALLPALIQQLIESGHLTLVRFRKWRDLVAHLLRESISLIGVEIHPSALGVTEFIEHHRQSAGGGGDVAFAVGNEGDGLSPQQMADCAGFVRIPQYGAGTASVNVAVAAGIVLHRFHEYQRQLSFERHEGVPSESDTVSVCHKDDKPHASP